MAEILYPAACASTIALGMIRERLSLFKKERPLKTLYFKLFSSLGRYIDEEHDQSNGFRRSHLLAKHIPPTESLRKEI